MGCFLNIVKNDAGMSGRNWQIFDLNIIAHFLAKRIFDKSANFEKYSLREIDSLSLGLSYGFVDSNIEMLIHVF